MVQFPRFLKFLSFAILALVGCGGTPDAGTEDAGRSSDVAVADRPNPSSDDRPAVVMPDGGVNVDSDASTPDAGTPPTDTGEKPFCSAATTGMPSPPNSCTLFPRGMRPQDFLCFRRVCLSGPGTVSYPNGTSREYMPNCTYQPGETPEASGTRFVYIGFAEGYEGTYACSGDTCYRSTGPENPTTGIWFGPSCDFGRIVRWEVGENPMTAPQHVIGDVGHYVVPAERE